MNNIDKNLIGCVLWVSTAFLKNQKQLILIFAQIM